MISKDEVNQKLRKMGYQVAEDSSVVTVLILSSVPLKSAIKDIKNKLSEMEYTASFGVKQYKGEGESTQTKQEDIAPDEDAVNEYIEEAEERSNLEGDEGVQFSLEDFGIGF